MKIKEYYYKEFIVKSGSKSFRNFLEGFLWKISWRIHWTTSFKKTRYILEGFSMEEFLNEYLVELYAVFRKNSLGDSGNFISVRKSSLIFFIIEKFIQKTLDNNFLEKSLENPIENLEEIPDEINCYFFQDFRTTTCTNTS